MRWASAATYRSEIDGCLCALMWPCSRLTFKNEAKVSPSKKAKEVNCVKHVSFVLPPAVLDLPSGYVAELRDFAPKGPMGDDAVYEQNHQVVRTACVWLLSQSLPVAKASSWMHHAGSDKRQRRPVHAVGSKVTRNHGPLVTQAFYQGQP